MRFVAGDSITPLQHSSVTDLIADILRSLILLSRTISLELPTHLHMNSLLKHTSRLKTGDIDGVPTPQNTPGHSTS